MGKVRCNKYRFVDPAFLSVWGHTHLSTPPYAPAVAYFGGRGGREIAVVDPEISLNKNSLETLRALAPSISLGEEKITAEFVGEKDDMRVFRCGDLLVFIPKAYTLKLWVEPLERWVEQEGAKLVVCEDNNVYSLIIPRLFEVYSLYIDKEKSNHTKTVVVIVGEPLEILGGEE